MSHTIYLLNIDSLQISDEALINSVETSLYNDNTLKFQGIDCFFPAKEREYVLSDFKELEVLFNENLTLTLNQKQLQRILLKRYLQAEILLYSCLNSEETGLLKLIAKKHKIIGRLDENDDSIFITPIQPERLLGLGGLLDNLFLYSVATGGEVKARLIKGYKYYN